MAKFWQKKYTSKYTGAEIDAAVAKAGNLPATTSADAGKALVVNEEGKVVTGEAGGGDIFTMHVEYNDDDSSNPFTITESAVDISNAIDANKIIKMIFGGSGAEYDFNGVAIPFSYTCEGVYEGEAGNIWIHMNDPYNNTPMILTYNHTTQKWSW